MTRKDRPVREIVIGTTQTEPTARGPIRYLGNSNTAGAAWTQEVENVSRRLGVGPWQPPKG